MNFGLAAAVFAVILPAELPDKTFISTIVLGSRYRASAVWVGSSAGLVLQAIIAVVLGGFLSHLPNRAVEAIVAVLFLGGAAYLLLVKEKPVEEEGEKIADAGAAEELEGSGGSWWKVAATTFVVVGLAEFGDLTQIIIANFTAHSGDPLSVFVGASLAFILIAAVGVLAGRTVSRLVPLALVRKLSGLVLLALGIWSLVNVIRG